jgi:Trypsin-co-occurring domain 1
MKRLVEFALADGGTITAEVEGAELGRTPTRGALSPQAVDKAGQTFEAALEKIRPAASAIIAQLRHLADPPSEAEVEFGIKLSSEAGALIASASAEANFKVTLTWKNKA